MLATFGAFFVAQRLKNAPPVLGQIGVRGVFSPNGDGRFDVTRLTFRVKETDTVSVAVLDVNGDQVRELLGGRHVAKGTLVRLKWDGRSDNGTRAPDGRYRYRITLQHKGRSVVLAGLGRIDTSPAAPHVTSIGPRQRVRPELLPRRRRCGRHLDAPDGPWCIVDAPSAAGPAGEAATRRKVALEQVRAGGGTVSAARTSSRWDAATRPATAAFAAAGPRLRSGPLRAQLPRPQRDRRALPGRAPHPNITTRRPSGLHRRTQRHGRGACAGSGSTATPSQPQRRRIACALRARVACTC